MRPANFPGWAAPELTSGRVKIYKYPVRPGCFLWYDNSGSSCLLPTFYHNQWWLLFSPLFYIQYLHNSDIVRFWKLRSNLFIHQSIIMRTWSIPNTSQTQASQSKQPKASFLGNQIKPIDSFDRRFSRKPHCRLLLMGQTPKLLASQAQVIHDPYGWRRKQMGNTIYQVKYRTVRNLRFLEDVGDG